MFARRRVCSVGGVHAAAVQLWKCCVHVGKLWEMQVALAADRRLHLVSLACTVFVQVGGLGVNLTGANCVIIFDPDVRDSSRLLGFALLRCSVAPLLRGCVYPPSLTGSRFGFVLA